MNGNIFNTALLCAVNIFFTFAGLFLNSVVICSLWKLLHFQKKTFYFMILVQSCIDLAVVTITHPWTIITSVGWLATQNNVFEAFRYFSRILYVFSFSALVTMNIDRFLATNRPFFHIASVTKPRLLIVMIVMQLLNVVGPTIKNIEPLITLGYILTAVSVSIAYVITFYMNYKIFIIAERARKTSTRSRFVNVKHDYTCLLATACFYCCSIPAIVYYGLKFTSTGSDDILLVFRRWARTVTGMNSTFNCLIYFWKNGKLRKEGKKVVKRYFVPGRKINDTTLRI